MPFAPRPAHSADSPSVSPSGRPIRPVRLVRPVRPVWPVWPVWPPFPSRPCSRHAARPRGTFGAWGATTIGHFCYMKGKAGRRPAAVSMRPCL
nr:hypothetical protein RVX_1547 [Nitratidesulfovibrio sp. HK-II]